MDFVVVGFGLGALVLLIGLAVRDLGPRLSGESNPETTESAGDPSSRSRRFALAKDAPAVWRRACHSLGQVIMIGGGIIVVATLLGIVGQFDDVSGARLVLAAALLAVGAIVLRAGQIFNNMYGADRRARAHSRPSAVLGVPFDSEHISPDEDTELAVSNPSANHSAAASANGAKADSTMPGEPMPSLPDLQTLLGERNNADHRRRDEIITLEKFLGLASEPTATAQSQANDRVPADGAVPSPEPSKDAEPNLVEEADPPSDDTDLGTSETTMEIADAAMEATADPGADEAEPTDAEPAGEAAATASAETEEITDAKQNPPAPNGLTSDDRSGAPSETVAQRS